ncbi:MAG: YqaJ viral recombinase family protein [Candidatus Phytoplasma australasiaticum]|nr:YqaJ viral recombinase family protein [Candidatus Phytoplasma australasiaticum]
MKINLNQRTKAWFQHRQKYINASEIGSITGLDPFRSLPQLVHDKLFGTTFTANKYTEHGNKTEPIARNWFEKITNLKFPDTIFTDDKLNMFSASLDGYNQSTNTLLEIKCPYVDEKENISSTWTLFLAHPSEKTLPKYYWGQVQCQLYCSQAQFAYFLVYFNDNNYHVVRIYQDHEFVKKMMVDSRKYLALLNLAKQELAQTIYLKQLSKFKS